MSAIERWGAAWADPDSGIRYDVVLRPPTNVSHIGSVEGGIVLTVDNKIALVDMKVSNRDYEYCNILNGPSSECLFVVFYGHLYRVAINPKLDVFEINIYPCDQRYIKHSSYIVFHDFFNVAIILKSGSVAYHRFEDVTAILDMGLNKNRRSIQIKARRNWGEIVDISLELEE